MDPLAGQPEEEAATGVDVLVEDPRWEEAGLSGLAGRAVTAALAHLGLDPAAWEVAILGCDDARIAELNATFRGKPAPTNVLSWPAEDLSPGRPGAAPEPPSGDAPELGDIAIAYDTCAREAAAGGKPLADHVTHLVVHGVLHLLGYDHQTEADATRMERLETEILGKMGVADPYS